ncbi:MAG: lecithin retinol acyltransferase family protein [Bacillota bacterium]|nr:lecithin retinol acyltransferase family protein [Bacillota bacterium]
MLFDLIEDVRDRVENIIIFGPVDGIKYNIERDIEKIQDGIENVLDTILDVVDPEPKKTSRRDDSVQLKAGDVIAVTRLGGIYQHFAVYIGNRRVIHFAGEKGDFGGENTIHEAPFEDFIKDSSSFEILQFDTTRSEPDRIIKNADIFNPIGSTVVQKPYDYRMDIYNYLKKHWNEQKDIDYHLYSPEETVQRAKMVAREWKDGNKNKYSLMFNNCEHFAIWCKTGIHESRQVEEVLDFLITNSIESRDLLIRY